MKGGKREKMENTNNEFFSESVNIQLGDIPAVDPKSSLNLANYEGKKVAIGEIVIKLEKNWYPDGQVYNPNSTEKMYRVYIYSEPLPLLDDHGNIVPGKFLQVEKNGKNEAIRVHTRFNLNTNSLDGKPEISRHPKAKLWAFIRKMGAQNLNELTGKLVLLALEPSKDENDDRKFLKIVT